MATIPKKSIQSLGRLVAVAADIPSLTPDTRPAAIRRALAVALSAGEDKELVARVVAEAFRISWMTTEDIMRELVSKK